MPAFCLLPHLAEDFKNKLKNGEINPQELADMTSEERRSFFSSFLGEDNAKNVNGLFEEKLLLKNQKAGMITWAKQVTGMKEETRRDVINKITKLDRVLNPTEEQSFLRDLAARKLGVEVTPEEAKQISTLAKNVETIRGESDLTKREDRIKLGRAMQELYEYRQSLVPQKRSLKDTVISLVNLPKAITWIANPAPIRLLPTMGTTPEFWKMFPEVIKYGLSQKAFDDMRANMIAHPDYEAAKKAGLRIASDNSKLKNRPDELATTLSEKIPIVRAGDRAWIGMLDYVRFERFVKLKQMAELGGEDVRKGSENLKNIANQINTLTNSGQLGANDKYGNLSPILSMGFMSPRSIAAKIEMIDPRRYADPSISPTARREAWRGLVSAAGTTFALMGLGAMAGMKTQWDPRSKDFGKLIYGNSKVDLTMGLGSYASFLTRLITGQQKSSTSEAITEMNGGYAGNTRLASIGQFLRGKLSPMAATLVDAASGKDIQGNPVSLKAEVADHAVPLMMSDIVKSAVDDPKDLFLNTLADIAGFSVQARAYTTDWKQSTGKELTQFRTKVGDKTFQQANDEYNTLVDDKIQKTITNPDYLSLTDQEKTDTISSIKSNIKESIFRKYHYHYTQTKTRANPLVKKLSR